MEAEVKSSDISGIVESYVEDLNIWGTLLDEYGKEIIDNFDNLAEGFYGDSSVISCVQMAPGGVVTYMHPYEGNEGAYGHDLFADPERAEEAMIARKTGNIIISGPLTLKQGGRGLISRIPIYSDVSEEPDHFWGFVMFLLDIDELNKQLPLEQYDIEYYDYRLWRPDGDEKLVVAESTTAELDNAVVVDVYLPTNVVWKLAVQPKNGWLNKGYLALLCLMGLFVFIMSLIFAQKANQKKEKIEKERIYRQELANALEEAKKANQAKRDFLAKMSHDIRTPINGVVGMTHIALKNIKDTERVEDCLNKIDTSSQHLLFLINDVLDISRIEMGKEVKNYEPFDMMSVLEKCKDIIQGQLTGKEIDFITDFTGVKHHRLIGDAIHLERIFINILGNSVKFTKEGKVKFSATESLCDDKLVTFRFVFEDTGIGISEEFLPRLFNEFSQDIDCGRTDYQGTGLGMAITKSYADMLDGKIDVESKLNVGTKFVVEIPVDINYEENAESTGVQDEALLSGRRILLVEDNKLNAEIAAEILKSAGAEITFAENGKIAVDIFKKSDVMYFDLILMDIMMPEMNGHEATKAIRKSEREDAKTIPIVAMTANAFEEDKQAALESGMNAHVAKPVDINVLLKVIVEVLSLK
jgi:signal transduction histidine kinase/CheY-like chemotaxis protein